MYSRESGRSLRLGEAFNEDLKIDIERGARGMVIGCVGHVRGRRKERTYVTYLGTDDLKIYIELSAV